MSSRVSDLPRIPKKRRTDRPQDQMDVETGASSSSAPSMAPGAPSAPTMGLARRPGYGARGRLVHILTNVFPITIDYTRVFHQYDVTMSNASKPDSRLPELLAVQAFNMLRIQHLNRAAIAYDGNKIAIANEVVPEIPPGGGEFNIAITDRKMNVTIRIVRAAAIDMRIVQDRMSRADHTQPIAIITDQVKAISIIFRELPRGSFPAYRGNKYFRDSESKDVRSRSGGVLTVIKQGLSLSTRPAGPGLAVVIKDTVALFRPKGRLLDYMKAILDIHDFQAGPLSASQIARLTTHCRGLKLVYQVKPGKVFIFPFKKFTQASARTLDFPFGNPDDGIRKTVFNYFLEDKQIRLAHPDLPCIDHTKGFLPPERVMLQENQILVRRASPTEIQEILRMSTHDPKVKYDVIVRGKDILGLSSSSANTSQTQASLSMSNFGLGVDNEPKEVQCRVLPLPSTVIFGDGRSESVGLSYTRNKSAAVTWRTGSQRAFVPEKLTSWALINASPRVYPDNKRDETVHSLMGAMTRFGMEPRGPSSVATLTSGALEEELKEAIIAARRTQGKCQILVVIIPDKQSPLYGQVKNVTLSDPLALCQTQILLADKLNRANNTYYANVALKINSKIGGQNWVLSPQELPALCYNAPTMIVGLSISHAPPGKNSPSVVGLAHSTDRNFSRYSAIAMGQEARRNAINHEPLFVGALRQFQAESVGNVLPQRIVVYRKGVSEAEVPLLLFDEVPGIDRAAETVQPGYRPEITYLVANKQQSVRFFATKMGPHGFVGGDGRGNLLPGSVVDQDVTDPALYDFFLISHAGALGTSKPTHYTVLRDDINMAPDDLYDLTFKLCFLYTSTPKPVSKTAPLFYAERINLLARHQFQSDFVDSDAASVVSGGSGSAASSSTFREIRLPGMFFA
ncbi:Piwi-domain-containing protein [Gonapodya prolifera JEL478]|uniref:Piwi-domain-containing protein n=1 Tax=Gonapodya prolifera (strain JEL478) TaxID=1344416 RepID=A0A139AGU1_GONPJ|nr:Piwi-domain-containing protein [Gonapodya prolifera JEL478]|eukprot:KXS15633.1 Piwi-domain-containing protein [Gonapodya prolifera JEL478]